MDDQSVDVRQHYIPRMLLKNFTDTGRKDGALYEYDAAEKRVARRNCARAAAEPRFYELETPGISPHDIEQSFNRVETAGAHALAWTMKQGRLPSPGTPDYDALLSFIALMLLRVPHWRDEIRAVERDVSRAIVRAALETEESWQSFLGTYHADTPESEWPGLEAMRQEAEARDHYYPILDVRSFHTGKIFDILGWLPVALHLRRWSLLVATDEDVDFVLSDRPVTIVWAPAMGPQTHEGLPGLVDIPSEIAFPLSSRIAVIGRYDLVGGVVSPGRGQVMDDVIPADKLITAELNARTAYWASRYVYARRNDFFALGQPHDQLLTAEDWFRLKGPPESSD